MRARALGLSILSSAAVIAVGWQLGTQGQVSTATDASAGTAPAPADAAATPAASPPATSSSSSGSAAAPSTAPTTQAPAPAATGVSGTFTGASASTRFGDVQVQITVQDGTITDVVALHLTDRDSRSVSISNRAAPMLRQQVLAAQSAKIQGVSGATYTSEGYLSSLQSALDQAGL